MVTPYTRQCFLWAAATDIFGRFWSFFCKKTQATYIAKVEGKKWGPNIILTPSNTVFFKGERLKPLVIAAAAADDCRGNVLRLFQNWGPSLSSGKLAGIGLWPNEDATDKETIRNYFTKLRAGPQFRKDDLPWKKRAIWGLKHSENGRSFFHTFLTHTKFTFCKKKW